MNWWEEANEETPDVIPPDERQAQQILEENKSKAEIQNVIKQWQSNE